MKKKNILIAFAMLLLTGVALSTATYAWFTANTKLELGQIDVKVSATNGILMSTDAINWKSVLTTEELKAATYTGSTNQFPTTLEPVSTIGSQTAGIFDMYYGTLQEDVTKITLRKDTDAQGTSGHYVAFDLFIQAVADDTPVKLLSTSSIEAFNVSSPGSTATDTGLKYSTRVGFLNKGIDATNDPATSYALNESLSASIWEPNADQHTDVAVGTGVVTNGAIQTVTGAKSITTPGSCSNGTDTTQVACQTNGGTWTAPQVVTVGAATHFGAITADVQTTNVGAVTADFDDLDPVFTVDAGVNKIRIYVWVEGQDADCENSASLGTGVRITLNFNAEA